MKVGYVYDEQMTYHRCETEEHPEKPDRVIKAHEELKKRGWLTKLAPCPTRRATLAELLMVHRPEYLKKLQLFSESHDSRRKLESEYNSVYLNEYTLISADVAAGSTLELATRILMKEFTHGLALVRPPGHHAYPGFAEGFCIFANVALSAKMMASAGKRVGIFDWDVHHGDGTEEIIKGDDRIRFISVQRHDHGSFFPGSGATGVSGNVYNHGFNGSITDAKYRKIFHQYVLPSFKGFHPEVIIISAGFDAAKGDPLGGCQLTPKFYAEMVHELKKMAPVMVVLEGGYHLPAVSECICAVAEELLAKH